MITLVDSRALRGANYYSYRPVIVLNVDLGEYDERFTNELEGFTDALLELIPSLEEHRCSEDERGGLIKRMLEGTLLGHVIEHVALELQYIAGMEVGFGKTIDTDAPGVYQVIFSYWVEEAGIAAGERAIDVVNAILEGRGDEIDLEGVIRELEDIGADHYLGPSTAAIVEEAEHRGITVLRLDDYNLVQLGEGKYQRRIEASITSRTSMIGVETAGNKRLTKHMLEDAGIPVPKGTVVRKAESAIEDAEWLGYPVVVKPHDGHHGKGVTTGISDEKDLREAFARAKEISDKVIVEKSYTGNDYRMLVVDGRLVAAAMREPAAVTGDGEHTIEELITIENRNPRRGYGHEKAMTRLSTSEVTAYMLERAGHTLETVLPEGGGLSPRAHGEPLDRRLGDRRDGHGPQGEPLHGRTHRQHRRPRHRRHRRHRDDARAAGQEDRRRRDRSERGAGAAHAPGAGSGPRPQRRAAHRRHALPARGARTTSASSPSPAPTARPRPSASSPTSWSTPAPAWG